MSVVTEYIDGLKPTEHKVFKRFREIVLEEVPEATETYSYGLPTFKYKDKYLIAFAANKKFLSIYPGGQVIGIVGGDLKKFATGRGTLSFTPDNQMPEDLLREVIQFCKNWIVEENK